MYGEESWLLYSTRREGPGWPQPSRAGRRSGRCARTLLNVYAFNMTVPRSSCCCPGFRSQTWRCFSLAQFPRPASTGGGQFIRASSEPCNGWVQLTRLLRERERATYGPPGAVLSLSSPPESLGPGPVPGESVSSARGLGLK